MAWNSFHFVENQGEITGKSFRTQTEQAINDIAEFAETAVELGIGDAAEKAGVLASQKAIEEVKKTAVLTEPQSLDSEKQQQARTNIGLASVVTSFNGESGAVTADIDGKIPKVGNRGNLSGFETVPNLIGSQRISFDSPDTMLIKTNGATTLTFVPASNEQGTVKEIALKAYAQSSLSVSGAVWANKGTPPTWGTIGKNLVIMANFIGSRVILSVADNDE